MVCWRQGTYIVVCKNLMAGLTLEVAHPYLISFQITFVDFLMYDVLDQNRMFEPKCLDEFKNLQDFLAHFEVGVVFL